MLRAVLFPRVDLFRMVKCVVHDIEWSSRVSKEMPHLEKCWNGDGHLR